MTELKQAPVVDGDKLMAFVFRAVEEVGATLNTSLVVMGDKLGYYRAMAASGPTTPRRLAADTGTAEPYAREWLNAQAAGAIVEHDEVSGEYTFPPEQVVAFTDESSPAFLPGIFQLALGTVRDSSSIFAAAPRGRLRLGGARPRRARGLRAVLPAGLSRPPGRRVAARAGRRGRQARGRGTVADVGCGHGASTLIMAEAFPRSTFVGYDYHAASIDEARARAEASGAGNRVRFEVASAASFGGTGYDLVTTFDALHDMGDPVGAARHVKQSLAADGTWMIVEPMAGDRLEDNLNPVGRVFYGFSTLLCTPASLSQEVGLAIGTQAGPARLREVVVQGGFGRFARVAETPFNQVLEVRA